MVSNSHPAPSKPEPMGWGWQLLAWSAAVALSSWGFLGAFAEWPTDLALTTLGWLLLGPVAWFLTLRSMALSGRHSSTSNDGPEASDHENMKIAWHDGLASLIIGSVAFGLSVATALPQWSLPPAYHDEYSYVFQAETLLAGRFSWPSAPIHPELFDQMHVLNEGRMASRYYPGTGLWIAPWLAFGNPYVGHWVAGALSAVLVYWIGRELSDRWLGGIAGITFAAAPGPALFSNLLLAHHPTMLALLVFTLSFLRGMRVIAISGRHPVEERSDGPQSPSYGHVNWLIAGCGLSAAMLCRPMTAAGFAFPFGLWAAFHLMRKSWTEVRPMLLGLGTPLLCGFGVMLVYNHDATGNWLTSPYQVYTDIYTPRHGFGLNNAIRGEQHLGPKVLESYDTWAENLTPAGAWQNVFNRLIATALFTVDMPLLLIAFILGTVLWPGMTTAWKLVSAAIVSLHAFHWPYWYVGIFGWHYVFETAPVWCLLLAYVGRSLQQTWTAQRRVLLPIWAAGLLVIAWIGMYVDAGEAWGSRWKSGIGVMAYPRHQYAAFHEVLRRDVTDLPALVLVDGSHDGQQLDFVTNHAGLSRPLILGRYRAGKVDWQAISSAFPTRHLYRYHLNKNYAEKIRLPVER